jgi:cation diffusion facilitator CzcD-associated flavoprotein CzcO/acetyl esterase/lipase
VTIRGDRSDPASREVDVAVVGAGFAGLYLLQRCREAGLSAVAFDVADDVGGTWYWNRYPGARCDVPTTDYSFSFDPEIDQEWTWSEKYATQPEILRYLQFIAARYDLRRDIEFSTRVEAAAWDAPARRWRVRTDHDDDVVCRFFVMASGCLSMPKAPEIEGAKDFEGDVYFTSTWPHEGVDFSGQRVAVIGTGSSAIKSIPLIAAQAAHTTVFQRTPNFSIPAHNGPPPEDRLAALSNDRAAYRESARWSRGGVPMPANDVTGVAASEEVARTRFESAWEKGELFEILSVFSDQSTNLASNAIVANMIREKIREKVDDPDVAEALCPRDYPFGTKRPCLDTNYYETFNRANVDLVDLRREPIERVTQHGLETLTRSFDVDAIVYATGFDAMTGAIVAVDIEGRDGMTLKDTWAAGPSTYLGLTTVGFPNFFMITGPGSPSVLSNMVVSIEQHVDWIVDCVTYLDRHGFSDIEPTARAQEAWDLHVADCGAITLLPGTDSWYMGANVPGKPRMLLPYIAGVDRYRAVCDEVVESGFLGFRLSGPGVEQCNDGVVRRMQLDVTMMLEAMASMDLPPLESLSPTDARAFWDAGSSMMPPGPDVGEVVDGVFSGPGGELAYQLLRPPTAGPHPVVLYFHGGGWLLGSATSDAALCRDLCVRADAIVVSVNYRHAPEHPYPAAADDACAAVRWAASNVAEFGGVEGRLVVAGWSAGANLAAVVCQDARDRGDVAIDGQLLLCPVVDFDFTRVSYVENAEGYLLTRSLMEWFSDLYVDPASRDDPRAAPLRGRLDALPSTLIYTAEFDPLHDGGVAYAHALEAAGVPVRHLEGRGQTHTSLTMVDVIISGAPVRAGIASWLRELFDSLVLAGR